jgi:hypothetical protein
MSSTNEQVQAATTRDELRNNSREDFLKRTRAQMEQGAAELGIEDTSVFGTKSELYDAMVKAARLPDQSLRGTSEIENPVAEVWAFADLLAQQARERGQPAPRRKDVVAHCVDQGIAYHTARTQYQAWYQHTQKGTRLMADGNRENLPKALRPVEPAEAEAES